MSAGPAPVRDRRSSLWVWLLGLFGAGVALLALLALGLTWYIARNVERSADGNRVEITTPLGSMRVDKTAAADTDLPVYPGASSGELGATIELTAPDGDALQVSTARYSSADSIDKIDEWYREKLGPDFSREGAGQARRKKDVIGITVHDNDIAFIAQKEGLMRVVALERRMGRVHINLARIAKNETQ